MSTRKLTSYRLSQVRVARLRHVIATNPDLSPEALAMRFGVDASTIRDYRSRLGVADPERIEDLDTITSGLRRALDAFEVREARFRRRVALVVPVHADLERMRANGVLYWERAGDRIIG